MAVGEARVPILHEERTVHKHTDKHHDTHKDTSQLSRGATVVTSLLAGATAGALAKTTIAPLDRTKINFQISASGLVLATFYMKMLLMRFHFFLHTPYSFRAAVNFLLHSARTDGFLALWRGNSATMARIVPYAAIQFTAHEQWKRVLGVDTPQSAKANPVIHLIAGSLAGVTSQSATYPLDLARARMAVTNASEYSTLRVVFVRVAREEGLRTLYRGFPATVLGVIPYAGVSFFTYDSLKHKYLEYFGTPQGTLMNVVFGGVAGALGQASSYPLDIVRRRMQTSKRNPDGTYPYSNTVNTLRLVYRSEGPRGFFKGLSMNWIKGPIAVGISFATYDAIKTTLRDLAVTLHS